MSNTAILFPASKNFSDYGDGDETEFEPTEFIIRVVNNGYILEDEGELHVYTSKNELIAHVKELI